MCLAALYWARVERIYFSHTRVEAAKIGFDDNFLYEEMTLPLEKRSIPIQCVPVESPDAFTLWEEVTHKTHY